MARTWTFDLLAIAAACAVVAGVVASAILAG